MAIMHQYSNNNNTMITIIQTPRVIRQSGCITELTQQADARWSQRQQQKLGTGLYSVDKQTINPAFIPNIFFLEGGIPPPQKNLQSPQTAAKLCALNLFLARTTNYKKIRDFLLTDNEHRKLLVIKQSKGANLCRKCTKVRLAAGLLPDTLGELVRSPRPTSRNGGAYL